MNRDIKTKPVSRVPREMDKTARLPEELIWRGMSDVKEKMSGQEREPAADSDTPENYATSKVQEGMDTAADKTGQAAANATRKAKDHIFKRIKTREASRDAANAYGDDANSNASGGGVHSDTSPDAHAPERRSKRQSVEQGKRRVQRMARERRTLRNADAARPAADTGKPTKGTVKTTIKSLKDTEKTIKATGKSIKTARKTTKTAAKTAKRVVRLIYKFGTIASKRDYISF